MKRIYCRAFVILFIAGFTLGSCSQNGGEQSTTEETTCPTGPQPQVADELDTLNVIIETSGSMGGFMPTSAENQTDFQMRIDNLLTNAEALEGNIIHNLRYYSARERMYKEVYSRFTQMLRRGLRNVGSSSPIPQMLENISEDMIGPEQVSVFISDFIYAPPNERDQDFIANDIRRALAEVRQKGYVVSVYAAQSDFSGTYYPADSESRPIRDCCDTPIPYYIWVIGPEEQVRLVNQEIIRDNYFEQVHFGFDVQQPSYMVIPGSGREGTWYLSDQEGKTLQVDNSRDIREGAFTYTIGLQLEGLPGQVTRTEYLEDNLLLDVRNGEGRIVEVYDAKQFQNQENINNKDRKMLECFSHFVKISVNKVFNRNEDIGIDLVLQNNLPVWIEEYTTSDDSKIEEEGPKTFSLNAIMEGARRVAGNQEKEFFNLTTTIDLSR